jgi:CubicO group peptidase (beta-lactamase class C family)
VGVGGSVAPGYEAVGERFAELFGEATDHGGAFAAYRDGALVVDLWGGVADPASGRPWQEDTLALIFSGTKGLVATCIALLLDRGALALEDPVARHWPAFGGQGKDRLRVVDVLSHRAGLHGIRTRTLAAADLLDFDAMVRTVAAETPLEPGRLCYHPLTYGWLAGELIRRAGGQEVGAFFAHELARPLGLDVWIGLPPEAAPRVATLHFAEDWGFTPQCRPDCLHGDEAMRSTWANPPLLVPGGVDWNEPALWRACIPGANAIGSARSIARLYACLARGGELDGVRLLGADSLAAMRRRRAEGVDPIVGTPFAFGAGFALQAVDLPFGPPAEAFGHTGAGGSIHGAWPRPAAGFSFVTNRLSDDPADARGRGLLAALHAAATAG